MSDDPRTEYPQPRLKDDTQVAPGITAKMREKPDHGEQS